MNQKTLSIFVDESGDFGKYDSHSPYYYVAMVFHDQSVDISEHISAIDEHLRKSGFYYPVFHAGPLIRREQVYKYEQMETRKSLFNSLFHFLRKLPIRYICPKINKAECKDDPMMIFLKLSKVISDELKAHYDYLSSFDLQIIYYDYGQSELTKIILSVFSSLFPNVEMRKVKPADYKLFQVADLICTMELTNDKAERNALSKSELEFFHSARDFKKNLYKYLVKKKL
ncbi:MAG: DUF3800 domain-containing protein [Treponema sp.]|nr:DUF3800 domain-containing protein [Treponema sp.]